MSAPRSAHRAESGFSLIELVVAVGVLTIILGAAFQLMTASQVSYDRNQILAEAHQNADFASVRIAELIRSAGANPNSTTTINGLNFITNKQNTGDPDNTALLHIRSDLDGDKLTDHRVTGTVEARYFLLSSEDITIQWYPNDTTVGGVAVPAHTICMIDNTPGTGQGVPIVLAEHIVNFECPVTPPVPEQLTLTLEAGPSKPIPTTDPRYITFTRVMQIRLRNRV
jgi:prepilin-type N-terminal cleavage/methylation domain-containing protein